MTGGGLMQLVAYGAQDVYLTGNPQITFFKVVYRRHTNFAMESIENPFNGAPNFGKKVTCTIQRNGDLIHRMYLQATLPQVQLQPSDGSGAQFRWLNWIGHNLIEYVEIEIGGQRIDKHYGDWLHIWNELTQEAGKQAGYAKMVGNVPELTNLLYQGGSTCDNDCYGGEPLTSEVITSCAPMYTLYIPLQFWFCRNPGLALPLIALQYHEVRINLEFNTLNNVCWDYSNSSDPHAIRNRVGQCGLAAASLYVDYIYLDTDERRKFAQVSHEYLIDVLQFTGGESITSSANKLKLQGACLGRPARLVRFVRRQHHQPMEGSAALQLHRLVGPLRLGVWLLGHSCGRHGWQEPSHHRPSPAQRPRPLPGSRGCLLQLGAAIPAPHQHPSCRHQRLLVRLAARTAPAIGHMQLVAY